MSTTFRSRMAITRIMAVHGGANYLTWNSIMMFFTPALLRVSSGSYLVWSLSALGLIIRMFRKDWSWDYTFVNVNAEQLQLYHLFTLLIICLIITLNKYFTYDCTHTPRFVYKQICIPWSPRRCSFYISSIIWLIDTLNRCFPCLCMSCLFRFWTFFYNSLIQLRHGMCAALAMLGSQLVSAT